MRALVLLAGYYGCAVYGFLNPIFGTLFFVHILLFRPENLMWGNKAFGRLHLVTSLLVLSGYILWRDHAGKRYGLDFQQRNVLTFFLFLGGLLLSTLFGEVSSTMSYDRTLDVGKIFLICFLFSRLFVTDKSLNCYVWVSILSLGALGAWGIQQGLRGNPRLDTLTVGGSNYLAAQLVLLIPLALAKACDAKLSRPVRLGAWGCTIAMSLCVVYSNSRGGFLGAAFALLWFLSWSKARLRIIVGIGLAGILMLPWIPKNYTERLSSISEDSEDQDLSARVRPVLWKIALRIWEDHPYLGVGPENFSPAKEAYAFKVGDIVESQDEYDHIFNQTRYTHGLYPGMLAETGIIGTGLFLILLLRNLACRLPRSSLNSALHQKWVTPLRAAQAGLLGFAVAAFFGDFQYIELLYFQIFFVGAIRRYAEGCYQSAPAEKSVITAITGEPVVSRATQVPV
jgi:probable O-glycosylation ligase (exosortase A-associated)